MGLFLLSSVAHAEPPIRPFIDGTAASTHVLPVQVGSSFTEPGWRLTGLVRAGVVIPVLGPIFVQTDAGYNVLGATNPDQSAFNEGTDAQADVQLRIEPFPSYVVSPYVVGGYSVASVTPYWDCYKVYPPWSNTEKTTCDVKSLISRGPSYGIGVVLGTGNSGGYAGYSGYGGFMIQFTHFSGNHDVWSNSLSVGFMF
ncbi:MPN domain-containing protein [Mangrovitalea sediminis]|uniref:hypothetical protein n=1 Tax=Mangrovitalea sediminis TaxID=1982043 RepID=UPI000BE5D7DB|nr:hypothetical protein [Mangrovitalea sediminis]